MRFFAILSLLLVAFAGCSDSGDDDPEPTTTPTQTATSTSSATNTATSTTTTTTTTAPEPEENETAENTRPTASIAASITNGEAPVEVAFTLNGTDADGDNLSWTFDADNDGTAELEGTDGDFPATLVFEYTVEGVYNATLQVGDGQSSTTRQVTINVTAAIEAPAGPTTQEFSGEWLIDNIACFLPVAPDTLPDTEGLNHAAMAVEPGTWGLPFNADWEGMGDNFAMFLDFYDAAGTLIESNADTDEGDFYNIQGIVPPNAATGFFYTCAGIPTQGVVYTAGA